MNEEGGGSPYLPVHPPRPARDRARLDEEILALTTIVQALAAALGETLEQSGGPTARDFVQGLAVVCGEAINEADLPQETKGRVVARVALALEHIRYPANDR